MRNVIIRPPERAPKQKRRSYPFSGAPPAPVLLTTFPTRRKAVEEEEFPVFVRKPNLAWMYASPPVVVNKITFLRKSSFTAREEEYPNVSRRIRSNPIFGVGIRQLIIMAEGPGAGQLGAPTLIGGRQRMQIFIGGVEVTDCSSVDRSLVFGAGQSVGAQPLRLSCQTIGRWQASFDLFDSDGSYTPQLGQTVLIQENGQRLLVGCVTAITLELFDGNNPFVIYHMTVGDKSSIFDHRVVLQRFFLAGTDIADVIRAMFTDSTVCNPPLQEEGITLNNLPASLGPLTTDLGPYNLATVTQVMDDLTTDLAGVWFIDTLSDLNVKPLGSLDAAPFTLTTSVGNWRRGSMTTSLFDYRNKNYAVSDRNVTPAADAPAITGTPIVETWTLPQQLANDLGYLPLSIVTNFPMLKVTGLTVNGIDRTAYIGTTYPPINFRHAWWYFPQTNNLIPPSASNVAPFPEPADPSPDPSPGDVVVISYIAPQQSAQVVTQDPLAPTFGTCGSGVWEVVTQVKGVTSQDVLNLIATKEIEKSGTLPKTIAFETDRPGLAVGQLINVTIPRLDLNGVDLMITSLDGTMQAGRLAFGSRMRWQVKATNTQDLGNWIKYMERLIRRTNNAIPVDRYEEASWVLAPGGSLAGGVVTSNPYVVRNTGQLFLAFTAANTAPVDQKLTLDIVSAQQGSLISGGPTPLIIPANSTSLIKVTQFTGDPAPFWIYKDDILIVTAVYDATGPDRVNAANITLGARWSY